MIRSAILGLVLTACIGHPPPGPGSRGTRPITWDVQCGVPATAPDLLPAWLEDPASHIRFGNSMVMVVKDVARVDFRAGATREERQAAIDAVAGCVVGGGGGLYYVRVPTDGTLASLERQLATLEALPQISRATVFIVSGLIDVSS